MELKYSQITKLADLSNEKIVGLIKKKIAESDNAAVSLVFDDKLIILETKNDEFYVVDYKIENNKLTLSNWEKINIIPDDQTKIEELAEKIFDTDLNEEIKVGEIVEAFKLKYGNENIKKLINKTVLEKQQIIERDFRIKSLHKLMGLNEEFSYEIGEIINDQKLNAIKESFVNPVQNIISTIDFKSPVSVYLFEDENDKKINVSRRKITKKTTENVKKKVSNLWTSETFKKDFIDLTLSENLGDGVLRFIDDHKEILVLNEQELEDLILKTSIISGKANLSEKMITLFKEACEYYDQNKIKDEYIKNLLEEAEKKADQSDEEDVSDQEEEITIDEASLNKIIKVMNKIKSKLDENSHERKYVEEFVKSLEDAKIGSIKEGKLKEVLDFLSVVYEKSTKKDGEEE